MERKPVSKNDNGKKETNGLKGQKGAVEGIRKSETPEERLSRIFNNLGNLEPYNEHYTMRDVAIDALLGIEDPSYVGPLINAMQNPDSDIRAKAALTLGRIGDDSAGPVLHKALSDTSWAVRENAVEALGLIKYKPAIPDLIVRVKGKTLTINESLGAVTALGNIGDEEAVPTLVKLTESKVWCVYTSAAVNALGQIGGTAAIEAIFNVLKDPDADEYMTKRAAAEAFLKVAPYFGDAYDPKDVEFIIAIARRVANRDELKKIAHMTKAC